MIEFDIKLTEIFDCFAVCELCNIKSLTREGEGEKYRGRVVAEFDVSAKFDEENNSFSWTPQSRITARSLK